MKKAAPDHTNVRHYFDQIAGRYPERYQSSHAFHASFFGERLQAATRDHDFQGKRIWDIGAGTGALYDYLTTEYQNIDYYACDLSARMLDQSRIPAERRQVGPPYWQQFPDHFFDFIFVLGVTSYLTRPELSRWLPLLARKLRPGGRLIISFTNAAAWEWSLRHRARPLIQRLARPDQLINQPFETEAYFFDDTIPMFAPYFQLRQKSWLYTSVPGLSRLWPRLSTTLGRRLAGWFGLEERLSTDFLLVWAPRHS